MGLRVQKSERSGKEESETGKGRRRWRWRGSWGRGWGRGCTAPSRPQPSAQPIHAGGRGGPPSEDHDLFLGLALQPLLLLAPPLLLVAGTLLRLPLPHLLQLLLPPPLLVLQLTTRGFSPRPAGPQQTQNADERASRHTRRTGRQEGPAAGDTGPAATPLGPQVQLPSLRGAQRRSVSAAGSHIQAPPSYEQELSPGKWQTHPTTLLRPLLLSRSPLRGGGELMGSTDSSGRTSGRPGPGTRPPRLWPCFLWVPSCKPSMPSQRRGARASDSASRPATWKEPYSHWLLCTSARHHPFWLKAGSGWGPIACLPRQDSFFKQLLVKKLAGSYRKTHLSYHSNTEGYRQTPRTCSPWISASLH